MRCRSASGCSQWTACNRQSTGPEEARVTRATRLRPQPSRRPTSYTNSGPTMLRLETKSRARALQILYAWEMQGAPPVSRVATGLARLTGPEPRIFDRAEALAAAIISNVAALDAEAASASENWRMDRMAVVERNI